MSGAGGRKGLMKSRIWGIIRKVRPTGLLRRRSPPIRVAAVVIPRLSEFSDSLTADCAGSEDGFIRMGQDLEALHGTAGDLADKTLETVRAIGGGDAGSEGILAALDRLVRARVERLEHRRRSVGEHLDRIRSLIGLLETLHAHCEGSDQIATVLRMVGFNVRVESARTEAAREMFTVVSQQITQLSEAVARIAGQIRESAGQAREGQRAVRDRITGSLAELDRLAESARGAVAHSNEEISGLVNRSHEVVAGAETHSREIARQVGEVVVGIQIHDSMTQRRTHVVRALADVAELIDPAVLTRMEAAEVARRMRAAHTIVTLQAAQVRQTIRELDTVHERVARAFDGMRNPVDGLADGLRSMAGARGSEGAADPFDRLRADLETVNNLMGRGSELMTAVETAATEASDTADQLTELMGQVDAIGFETHLIALNAIIKAAHLDAGGRPLEILAQEVKILSDQTGAFVTDVKEILNAVVESRLDETPMPDESHHGVTAVEAADSQTYGIEEIADAYNRFGSGSEAAAGAAESLRKALAEAPARLTFLEDLSQALAADLEIIEAASRDLEPWADPAGTAGSEETRRLAERYTMQQERGIHHEMLKTGENTPAEDAAGTSEPDLGDNVELF